MPRIELGPRGSKPRRQPLPHTLIWKTFDAAFRGCLKVVTLGLEPRTSGLWAVALPIELGADLSLMRVIIALRHLSRRTTNLAPQAGFEPASPEGTT